MTKIGYARVSTIDQDFEVQQQRLKAEGCAIIRSEKVSGASRDGRHELATVIEFLREGDELIVTRLDRLGRDTRDVLNIVQSRGSAALSLLYLMPLHPKPSKHATANHPQVLSPSSTSIEVDVESPEHTLVTSQSIHRSPDAL